MHRIVRFEELPDSFNALLRDLKLPKLELPTIRKTSSRRNFLDEYFDSQDLVAAVRRLCESVLGGFKCEDVFLSF